MAFEPNVPARHRRFLALIPARGGSKGVPRKNLAPLDGLPMIAHSIRHAQQATKFLPRVMVSTEDHEIADVAESFGAEVIRRPGELATDTASTDDVIRHALNHLKPWEPVIAVLLQPTSPIRPPGMVDEAISHALKGSHTVLTAHRLHFVWQKDPERNGWLTNCGGVRRPMRQAMTIQEHRWAENGNLYAFWPDCLWQHGGRVCSAGRVDILETSAAVGHEVDAPMDLVVAGAILKTVREEGWDAVR